MSDAIGVNYWLFKTEPDDFSIDDLQRVMTERWDGIRNYQARNLLRDQVTKGDQVLIYHSRCNEVGVAGIAEVITEAYPDPAQFEINSPYFDAKASLDAPRWVAVDVMFVEKFPAVLSLKRMKSMPELSNMVLFKQGRLSVQPVTSDEWSWLLASARGSS